MLELALCGLGFGLGLLFGAKDSTRQMMGILLAYFSAWVIALRHNSVPKTAENVVRSTTGGKNEPAKHGGA
jgi:hypothetical protein